MFAMTSTTIQISQDLRQELNRKKLFRRETYEEVIRDILEDTKELSDETKKEIKEARAQIERGEYSTLAEVKKIYMYENLKQ